MDQIEELLTRGVANIISNKEDLRKRLESGDKLNIYLGIDPTATKIHLGHAVPLRKLQKFAELGHHVTFLIGDFTSLIGDTSDKDGERPVLTSEQIEENFKTYKTQAEKILDFSKVEVRHNSEWLSKLNFAEIVQLCQHFSVGDFTSRELIRKRLDNKTRVGLHEFLYPVMQGYDSYFMDTDIQLGGTDQTFNMQAGRTLQKDLRNKESFVMSNVFLEGTDGRKMSKSWGNGIWLEDSPEDMYAKVMAVHDDFIANYYLLGTNAPLSEVDEVKNELAQGAHPMDIKKRLAKLIVTELHSTQDAEQAAEHFQKTVQDKEVGEIEDVTVTATTLSEDILVTLELAASKSDAKRLFEQGGVSINGGKVDMDAVLSDGDILKVGKRKTVRISIVSNS